MFCLKCGNACRTDAHYCDKCGIQNPSTPTADLSDNEETDQKELPVNLLGIHRGENPTVVNMYKNCIGVVQAELGIVLSLQVNRRLWGNHPTTRRLRIVLGRRCDGQPRDFSTSVDASDKRRICDCITCVTYVQLLAEQPYGTDPPTVNVVQILTLLAYHCSAQNERIKPTSPNGLREAQRRH